ncbi:WXG100 family type VII secretion target [Streptosporangium subroseum]|uniref:WXG100 family type VII secretion target n=1 Tax=Streptosporangium subroseum TaxID=106412 RepID=UPI00343C53BD
MPELDDYTKVNFGEMELKYGELKKIAGLFTTRFEELVQKIQAELGAHWEGEAKNFFLAEQDKWNHAAARMNAELEAAGKAIQVANDNYIVAERANQAMWNN